MEREVNWIIQGRGLILVAFFILLQREKRKTRGRGREKHDDDVMAEVSS